MYHSATDTPARSSKVLLLWMERNRLKICLLFSSATSIHISIQLGGYLLSCVHFTVNKEFADQLHNLSKIKQTKNQEDILQLTFYFIWKVNSSKPVWNIKEHFSRENGRTGEKIARTIQLLSWQWPATDRWLWMVLWETEVQLQTPIVF